MGKVFLTFLLLLVVTGLAFADSRTFNVSATLPDSTGMRVGFAQAATGGNNITASSVSVSDNSFTVVNGTSLSFDPLTFNTNFGIYTPNHYFAIDIAPVGGNKDIFITYSEGANPNNAAGHSGHGLGWKTTAAFFKEVGKNETPLIVHPKKMLKDLDAHQIGKEELGTGFLRIYLGVETNPTASGEPAGSEVISGDDAPGTYTGSLVISSTVT